MGFPRWVGASRCSGHAQPGVQAFARWCQEEYGNRGYFFLGIYNCRTVRGGSTTSLHGEGRALDAGFPVGDPDGNHLLRRLLKVPGRLGIQAIIYERKIYSRLSPDGRRYTGEVPHLDHLHIEFTWEAARNLNFRTISHHLDGGVPRFKPGERVLREGVKGTDVRWLQRKLTINDDGVFGPNTKNRVLRFEQNHRKEYPRMSVDGTVGPVTWKALGVNSRA